MFEEQVQVQNGPRVFQATVPVSGPVDVPFDDWPAQMQDQVQEAMEVVSKKHGIPLALVHTEYRTDPDVHPEAPGHHYVWIVVSEIIVAASPSVH